MDSVVYMSVWTRDGAQCDCVFDDEPMLDAAVTRWAIEKRDELLSLTALSGARYKVLASEVTSWLESTPETRERGRDIGQQMQEETPAPQPWETND
jgi:hypothetical protein